MRSRPPIFRALGNAEPPLTVIVDGQVYHRRETYKHDSWAATAVYHGADFNIVCKFNRVQPVILIPMTWLGIWLAKREKAAYEQLEHIEGIARGCGPVFDGNAVIRNAVAHQFVAGQPLRGNMRLSDDFFLKLQSLLSRVHEAGYAYVDLHKRENILLGENGNPHLIDFQVSFRNRWKLMDRLFPGRWLLHLLQSMDLFCLYKHVRHFRPDLISELGLERFQRVPWWIRLHRSVAIPFRSARRRMLSLLAIRDSSGLVRSELFTEHGLRE